jgi:hypothetical protein
VGGVHEPRVLEGLATASCGGIEVWEIDVHCRPLSAGARDFDLAAVSCDELVHDCETQACPAPGVFRSEKGLEHSRLDGRVDAGTVVADAHARRALSVSKRRFRRELELSASRERVARVQDEIHEHELELRGVGKHRRPCVAGRPNELDVLADHRSQQRFDGGEDRVQVDRLRIESLRASEAEQLADDPSGIVCGVLDRGQLIGCTQSVAKEPGVAADDEE